MKAEHADLRRQIQAHLFENNLEPKSKEFLTKLEELKMKKEQLANQYDTAPLIGPKEQDLLNKLQDKRTALENELRSASSKQYASDAVDNAFKKPLDQKVAGKVTEVQQKLNVLDLIEQKAHKEFETKLANTKSRLAQGINKTEADISDLGRGFGSKKEQTLIAMRDKAQGLETQISQLEARYRVNRFEKFNRMRGQADRDCGVCRERSAQPRVHRLKTFRDGFVKFVRGEPAGSKVVSAAEKGNVISKDLYDGLVAAPDISGFNADMGQFTTNFDDLETMTKGAFSREVKQDLYNKSIQSYEISNHFLEKVNGLMEKHGLTDADGHTFTRYVEGEIQAPPGREAAFAAAKEDMRQITDEALDLRNARRVQRGEQPIPRRDNYITVGSRAGDEGRSLRACERSHEVAVHQEEICGVWF
jgi:hypothetical protein